MLPTQESVYKTPALDSYVDRSIYPTMKKNTPALASNMDPSTTASWTSPKNMASPSTMPSKM